MTEPVDSRFVVARKTIGGLALRKSLSSVSSVVRRLPIAQPARHDVELIANVPYLGTGMIEHTYDVWRPNNATGPLPLVVYVHGGAFRALSKDTHWIMGLQLARRGLCVVLPNYRLAPEHRYPAGSADAAAAVAHAHAHAERFGADPYTIALMGESAGANIVLGLAVGVAWDVPTRHLDALRELPIKAVVPACGVMQVGDAGRFRRVDPRFHWFFNDRVEELAAWLPRHGGEIVEDPIASPLPFLETASAPTRAVPPMFLPVGGGDFLKDDHARLHTALNRFGVVNEVEVYGREPHAFHAFVWRKEAKRFWNDTARFLNQHGVPTTALSSSS